MDFCLSSDIDLFLQLFKFTVKYNISYNIFRLDRSALRHQPATNCNINYSVYARHYFPTKHLVGTSNFQFNSITKAQLFLQNLHFFLPTWRSALLSLQLALPVVSGSNIPKMLSLRNNIREPRLIPTGQLMVYAKRLFNLF